MISLAQFLAAIVKILVMVGFLFNVGGLLTWVDRRQGAMIQDRVGPNRAAIAIGSLRLRIAGLLHTAADGLKFFFKEDFMPPKADKLLFSLAPVLSMVPVLALVAVIPMTQPICLDTQQSSIWTWVWEKGYVCEDAVGGAIAPLNVGILYVFAMAGQGIVGAAIAGWSSDNKFSLLGALRAASQMVSYEVAIGLSLVGCMMCFETVQLDKMAEWQSTHAWGIYVQPLAFFLFFVSATAESKRIPFDLPEAESELVSGYFTEYSGMKFGMFYFAEYMEVVTSSMLLVCCFLGGYALPFVETDGIRIAFAGSEPFFVKQLPHVALVGIGVLAFFGKTLFLCFIQAFIRWSLPRFRYDQLMKLGWLVLLPASLINIVVTGVVTLGANSLSESGKATLATVGSLTQAFTALFITYLFVRLVMWVATGRKKQTWILGTAAKFAAARGGTKSAPMGA
jgi:NADH-quinone oxidoreductase subunit H